MATSDDRSASKPRAPVEPDMHGAALVDADGHEIPITEAMIRAAIQQLDPESAPEGGGANPQSSDCDESKPEQ